MPLWHVKRPQPWRADGSPPASPLSCPPPVLSPDHASSLSLAFSASPSRSLSLGGGSEHTGASSASLLPPGASTPPAAAAAGLPPGSPVASSAAAAEPGSPVTLQPPSARQHEAAAEAAAGWWSPVHQGSPFSPQLTLRSGPGAAAEEAPGSLSPLAAALTAGSPAAGAEEDSTTPQVQGRGRQRRRHSSPFLARDCSSVDVFCPDRYSLWTRQQQGSEGRQAGGSPRRPASAGAAGGMWASRAALAPPRWQAFAASLEAAELGIGEGAAAASPAAGTPTGGRRLRHAFSRWDALVLVTALAAWGAGGLQLGVCWSMLEHAGQQPPPPAPLRVRPCMPSSLHCAPPHPMSCRLPSSPKWLCSMLRWVSGKLQSHPIELTPSELGYGSCHSSPEVSPQQWQPQGSGCSSSLGSSRFATPASQGSGSGGSGQAGGGGKAAAAAAESNALGGMPRRHLRYSDACNPGGGSSCGSKGSCSAPAQPAASPGSPDGGHLLPSRAASPGSPDSGCLLPSCAAPQPPGSAPGSPAGSSSTVALVAGEDSSGDYQTPRSCSPCAASPAAAADAACAWHAAPSCSGSSA